MNPPRQRHPLRLPRLHFLSVALQVLPQLLPRLRQRPTLLSQRPGFPLVHQDPLQLRRRSQLRRRPLRLEEEIPLLLLLPLLPLVLQLLLLPLLPLVLPLPHLLQLLVQRHRLLPLGCLVVPPHLAALPSVGPVVEEEQVLAAVPKRRAVDEHK